MTASTNASLDSTLVGHRRHPAADPRKRSNEAGRRSWDAVAPASTVTLSPRAIRLRRHINRERRRSIHRKLPVFVVR